MTDEQGSREDAPDGPGERGEPPWVGAAVPAPPGQDGGAAGAQVSAETSAEARTARPEDAHGAHDALGAEPGADAPQQPSPPGWGDAPTQQPSEPPWGAQTQQPSPPGWGDTPTQQPSEPPWGTQPPPPAWGASTEQPSQAAWGTPPTQPPGWGGQPPQPGPGWGQPPGPQGQPTWGQPAQQGWGQPGQPSWGTPPPSGGGSKAPLILGGVVLLVVVVFGVLAILAAADDDDETASESTSASVDRESVDAFSLEIGDCILDPLDGEDEGEVLDVEAVDCAELHDREVYALIDHPAGDDAEFVGDDEIVEFSGMSCEEEFEDFIGVPYAESEFFLTFLHPTDASWADGDREVVCLVYDPDEAVTGSLRNANS